MSRWYAAHLLMYVRRKHRADGKIRVWENIVLVKADSEEAAFAKAEEHGKNGEGDDDGTFRWDGEPATWVFAGVRKLTLCEDPEKRPGDGTEISYTELEVKSAHALSALLQGKPAAVNVVDTIVEPEKSTVQRETVRQPP